MRGYCKRRNCRVVYIFAQLVFSRYAQKYVQREEHINFIIAKNTKNANFNPSKIAHFVKSAKIYTCKNNYVYSISVFLTSRNRHETGNVA